MTRARRWKIVATPFFSAWVHRISEGDDRPMHTHPWPNVSVILRGSYRERTPAGAFVRAPGDIIHRRAEDAHAIEILERPCWTLFLTGPERWVQRGDVRSLDWGYLCRGRLVPWWDFDPEAHHAATT